MEKQEGKAEKKESVNIPPIKLQIAEFKIRGTTPYVCNKFDDEVRRRLEDEQAEGAKPTRAKRGPKDFPAQARGSTHKATDGWIGIPATAFRNAMVSACRVVNFKMTLAKLCITAKADGYDESGTPLVRITKGEPVPFTSAVNLANSKMGLTARMKFDPGWEAMVRIEYDTDQFKLVDIANLMVRVGAQVGIGAGRNDSKTSCGMGWGAFEVVNG